MAARPPAMVGASQDLPTKECLGFRLILSDSLVSGGQRVKTFNVKPLKVQQIIGLLREHFGFDDICKGHGLEAKALDPGDPAARVNVVGFDGRRRVPIASDEQLAAFTSSLRNTQMPSVEFEIARVSKGDAVVGRRQPQDRVEELEDMNSKLTGAAQRLERRVEELERLRARDRDETERLLEVARKDLTAERQALEEDLRKEVAALHEMDATINEDAKAMKKRSNDIEKTEKRHNAAVEESIEKLSAKTTDRFADASKEVEALKAEDARLRQEDERMDKEIVTHSERLKWLAENKVDNDDFEKAVKDVDEKRKEGDDALSKRLEKSREEVDENLDRVHEELKQADASLSDSLARSYKKIEGELGRLEDEMNLQMKDMNTKLEGASQMLVAKVEADLNNLSESCDSRFNRTTVDLTHKDAALHKRVDAFYTKTETTFQGLVDRLEALTAAERERLAGIEQDVSENFAKCRSDFRTDCERLRNDYEQECARLDGDLNELHMKHDVTKQEITFFQSRLLEQRDWAHRQFVEQQTAMRAGQVDAQEGISSSASMCDALRDDQVSFREKMAKHVGLLQHSADSHSEAISTLENQRSRMKLDLDTLVADHADYVGDMDGWAEDVRVKVERIFRAMEPQKCEWRIERAAQRGKELKNPLALKSAPFALQGLCEVAFEFFPNGHGNSPDGKSVLRLLLPPQGSVRYQVYLGRLSDGSRDFSGQGNLTADIFFDDWMDQIKDDGSICITMEVLQDKSVQDTSLARQVLLESP